MKTWYIIPARSGSKGLPGKNRILFDYTARLIPNREKKKVIVSTDDDVINEKASSYGFLVHERSKENSSDNASTREVLLEVIKKYQIEDDDQIVLLYLTYPGRKWKDVIRAKKIVKQTLASSLLCKKEIKTSPYLMFYDLPENKGEKVIDHDFCRRQDYRKCFEVSHYIGLFKAECVKTLDTNLWNRDTIFMPITDEIDIDYKEDLEVYLEEKNENKSNS